MMVEPWWEFVSGPELAQGEFLRDCVVPLMPSDFESPQEGLGDYSFTGHPVDAIVITQSCDLENKKAPNVALSPLYSLDEYEATNPKFKTGGRWNEVRQGHLEGLHMLASFVDPEHNRGAWVVDFRQIYSLPIGYLSNHAARLGERPRLVSPYVEHFSQAFARFFMRVGLPSTIPPFN